MRPGTLQAGGQAFEFEARLADIDQKTQMQADSFEVVQTLRAMDVIERPHRLEFNQDTPFDQQIDRIFADYDSIISDERRIHSDSRFTSISSACICVHLRFNERAGFEIPTPILNSPFEAPPNTGTCVRVNRRSA
jgi:hypothetical protein